MVNDEELSKAVQTSRSMAEVLRTIGVKKSGGAHTWYSHRVKSLGLDTSHFTSLPQKEGLNKRFKTATEILIVLPDDSWRPRTSQLKRAMLEVGMEYKCICGLTDEWQGSKIVLEIHHIDGNWLNNLQDNLRFMCPNCHSQQ